MKRYEFGVLYKHNKNEDTRFDIDGSLACFYKRNTMVSVLTMLSSEGWFVVHVLPKTGVFEWEIWLQREIEDVE